MGEMSYCSSTTEGVRDSSGEIDHGGYLEQEERRAWNEQFSAGGGFQTLNPGMHLSGIPSVPLPAVAGTNSGHVWDQHVGHGAMHHQVAIDRYSPAHRAAVLHQRHQGLHGGGHQHSMATYGCQPHVPDQMRILAHRTPGHVGTTPSGYDEDWNESPFWGIEETPAATAGENARYSTATARGLESDTKSGAGEHKAGPKRTNNRQHNLHGASTAGAQRDVSKSSAPPSAPDNGSCGSSPPTSLIDDSDAASPPGTPSMFVNPDTSNKHQRLPMQQQHILLLQKQSGGASLSPNSVSDDVVKGASASNSVSGASTASMDAYLMQFYRGIVARANEHEMPEIFWQQAESRQGMSIMDKNASLEWENEMLRGMLAR